MQERPNGQRVLHSWKEIANHMGRGVRTVQRYELALRLPVRRPAGKERSAVLAFTDELDEWLRGGPTRNGTGNDSGRALMIENPSESDLKRAEDDLEQTFAAYQAALSRYEEVVRRISSAELERSSSTA
jgi:hypothetical protein